jgi:hypothetical protein
MLAATPACEQDSVQCITTLLRDRQLLLTSNLYLSSHFMIASLFVVTHNGKSDASWVHFHCDATTMRQADASIQAWRAGVPSPAALGRLRFLDSAAMEDVDTPVASKFMTSAQHVAVG